MKRAPLLIAAARERAPDVVWDALEDINDVVSASCALINDLKREGRALDYAELVALMEECQQTKLAIVEHLVQFTRTS